jgi:hypothetical protein
VITNAIVHVFSRALTQKPSLSIRQVKLLHDASDTSSTGTHQELQRLQRPDGLSAKGLSQMPVALLGCLHHSHARELALRQCTVAGAMQGLNADGVAFLNQQSGSGVSIGVQKLWHLT